MHATRKKSSRNTTSTIEQRLFDAVRRGNVDDVDRLVRWCSYYDRHRLLSIKTKVRDEELTLLIVAAKYGKLAVVQLLVRDFMVPVTQTGTAKGVVSLERDATALWFAAFGGHVDVVQFLVSAGAAIDRATWARVTPLHAAVQCGHGDVVKLLLEHGADPNVYDERGATSLSTAASLGSTYIASLLVHAGASLDHCDKNGESALHRAAKHGRIELVSTLVSFGADQCLKNAKGLTPSMLAAWHSHDAVVIFLTSSQQPISTSDRVSALEVLAGCLTRRHFDVDRIYAYLKRAMALRESHCLQKELLPPVEEYDLARECVSMHELEAIRNDPMRLRIEGLLALERTLGRKSELVWQHVYFLAQKLIESRVQFINAAKLFLRAIHLHGQVDVVMLSHLSACVVRGYVDEHAVPQSLLKRTLELLCQHIEECTKKETSTFNNYRHLLGNTLHIIAVVTKCLPKLSIEESMEFRRFVFRICKAKVRLPGGYTLLHMAVGSFASPKGHTTSCLPFPDCDVVKMLLECGHKSDCTDSYGNTPLHVVVRHRADAVTVCNIIGSIAAYGGHLDFANRYGKTPLDYCALTMVKASLWSHGVPRLQCLAARATRRAVAFYQVFSFFDYQMFVPKHLMEAVVTH